MKKYLFSIAIIGIMMGCNGERKYGSNKEYAEVAVPMDSTASDTTASPKIVKTADMRFRVKDVQKIKEQLTTHLKAQGGTVTEFEIHSLVQESEKVKYSADSLMEITAFRKEGTLVANVPSEKLDDLTNLVVKMAIFVDNQSLKMDDKSLVYLANRLKAQNRKEAIAAINKAGRKKGTNAETSLYIKDDYIDKKIENMSIDDKVKYSTITLSFYQDNTIHRVVVANDNLKDYGPGFFKRMGLNILVGWSFLKEFVLVFVALWPFLILGLAVFFTVRYFSKKKRQLK